MLTTIYFIRHARTYNPKHIIKGLLPGFKLTKAGQQEVEKLGKYLKTKPITKIFYSPLLRTKQTATIIKKYLPHAKLVPDKRLIEWQTAWEGLTIQQVKALAKMHWDLYHENPLKFKTAKGPTARQVVRQINSFTKMVLKKFPDQEIVAISHGDPIKLYRCYLETKKISKKFLIYPCTQPSSTAFVFKNGKFQKTLYKSFIKKQRYFIQ